jgi:hypothetical protein
MAQIVRQPCPELIVLAEILDEAIGIFIDARHHTAEDAGRWEAPLEAWAMSNVMVRNIEATTTMARHDEVLVTAAWSNARVAFEHSVRIIWLLFPNDRFESEMRWIALLAERERFHRYMAASEALGAESAARHRSLAETVHRVRIGVESQVPDPYRPMLRVPRIQDMLREMGTPEMYTIYRESSQYIHAAMPATSHYIENFGSAKTFGEFTSTVDWILPLRLCWFAIRNASHIVVDRLCGPAHLPDWAAFAPRVDSAFQELVSAAFRGRDS